MITIYKLSFNEYYYIGSTTDLKRRIIDHKSKCFNENGKEYNKKLYRKIRECNIDFDDIVFEEIDCCFEWENRNELENVYIDLEDEKCLNSQKENQGRYTNPKEYSKEYYENNKEYKKEYYENNKEKLKEKKYCEYCKNYTTKSHWSRHIKLKKHLNNLI